MNRKEIPALEVSADEEEFEMCEICHELIEPMELEDHILTYHDR